MVSSAVHSIEASSGSVAFGFSVELIGAPCSVQCHLITLLSAKAGTAGNLFQPPAQLHETRGWSVDLDQHPPRTVAVTTRIFSSPPHRSRRRLLTHRARPSGQTSHDKRFSVACRPTTQLLFGSTQMGRRIKFALFDFTCSQRKHQRFQAALFLVVSFATTGALILASIRRACRGPREPTLLVRCALHSLMGVVKGSETPATCFDQRPRPEVVCHSITLRNASHLEGQAVARA